MEIETLNTQSPFPEDNMSPNSAFFTFDLPTLIESMKHSYSWGKGELNAMILLKSQEKKILLTALHEGTEINSFQSNESISLQILEGRLEFHTWKESVILDKGQLLTLHDKIKYSLTSSEETVFLLTVVDSTIQKGEN
jgi:quercetin dioxygenase-like cupin family protein